MEWKQTTPAGNPSPEFTMDLGDGYSIWLRGDGTAAPFRASLLKGGEDGEKEITACEFWIKGENRRNAAGRMAAGILLQKLEKELHERQNARKTLETTAAASEQDGTWYRDEGRTWRAMLRNGWTLTARPPAGNEGTWAVRLTDRDGNTETRPYECKGATEEILERIRGHAAMLIENRQTVRAKSVMEPITYLELPEGAVRLSDAKHQIFQLFCNGIEHLDAPLSGYLLSQNCVGEYDGKSVIIRDEKKLTAFLQKICRMEGHA